MGMVTVSDRWRDGDFVRGHFIYLGFAEESGGLIHVKAGRSSDPYRRFLTICAGSPLQIKLFWFARMPNYEACKQAERLLHRSLARFRTGGEWYVFDANNAENKSAFHAACRFVRSRFTPGDNNWDSVNAVRLRSYALQQHAAGARRKIRFAA